MSRTANDFSTFIELVRYRGDGPISIPLTSPDDGTDFTPTGNALIFTLKADPADLDVDALVQKVSTVGGITVANPSVVTLVPADFAGLEANVTYHFDIQAQLSASPNTIRTVARGTIRFAYDVTQETTISIATTTTNPTAGYTWANIPDKPSVFPATLGTRVATTVAAGASVTLTLEADARWLLAQVTCSGTGTAVVVLSATNAADGCLAFLRLVLPALAGLTIEVRNATSGGTLLASVATDGTAGVVGVVIGRGASAWDDPTQAAWID